MCRRRLLMLALLFSAAPFAGAQELRGTVRDSAGGRAIPGAVLLLQDGGGQTLGRNRAGAGEQSCAAVAMEGNETLYRTSGIDRERDGRFDGDGLGGGAPTQAGTPPATTPAATAAGTATPTA